MSAQPYNTTMSWQQLIAAVQKDMAALYAGVGSSGTVTSIGLTPGSSDIVVSAPNPVTTSGNIPIDLSAAVKTALTEAGTALQSISIGTGTGLSGGPLSASGSTVALNSTSIANLNLAANSLQPVTGLAGSYTYASITLNAAGQIVAVSSGTAPPAAGNPTGTVGTMVANGVATTFMRSDAAPPINQAITPLWTSLHTFSAGALIANAQTLAWKQTSGATVNVLQLYSDNNVYLDSPVSGGTLFLRSNAATKSWSFGSNGALGCPGPIGVNGATPPTQVTGWGTPTGAAVVANFNGASGTLVNCSNAIAEIITILKAVGLIGA